MPDMIMVVDVALSEVPVNILPLLDDGDFKTIEDAVAHNAAGMDLRWNFVSVTGAFTSTAVTPTSGGTYDWAHQGDGMYSIEIPASGGASINNDAEGFGWFTGKATGVLPWRGPIIQFSPADIAKGLVTGEEFLPVDSHKQDFEFDGTELVTKKPDGTTDTDYSPKTVATDAGADPIVSST